jgi:hypothetical protein
MSEFNEDELVRRPDTGELYDVLEQDGDMVRVEPRNGRPLSPDSFFLQAHVIEPVKDEWTP